MKELTFRMIRYAIPATVAFFLLIAPLRAQDSAGLYKSKCAACHDADGSGNGPMGKALGVLDLRSDEVQKQTDAQLTDSITNGKGAKMPAYKDKLTGDEIKGLVGYIRELAKKK
ncbi:MAG: cytochrome c [Candidatus Acidiferrales bacterium]